VRKIGTSSCLPFIAVVVLLLAGCAGAGKSKPADGELLTMSDQTSAQKRAAINLELAVGYYQRHENSVALDKIKLALAADPDFSQAYDMRALIYMDMHENRLADENFQHALRLAPANPEYNNNYGWFLCSNGRERESIAYFETAIKDRNYTSPAVAMDNAGMCSLKLGNQPEAEVYFKRAFNFDPGNLKVNENLAQLFYTRKEYDQAKFYIGRLIKANVTDASVLWLGIKIAHKSGDRMTEGALGAELQRFHADSLQYASFQREAFDE